MALGPQHDAAAPRKGLGKPPLRTMTWVMNPPIKPMPIAAISLAMVNSSPITLLINKNIDGLIKGEDSQNAMTGAKGTPAANKAAMIGITPQEQKGAVAPNAAAKTMDFTG